MTHRKVLDIQGLNVKLTIKIIEACIVLSFGCMLFAGCSSSSSSSSTWTYYLRNRIDKGEIFWSYDKNGLKANQDTLTFSEQNGWDGLSDAVSSVPEAKQHASSAITNRRIGKVLNGIALPAALGVAIGGLVSASNEHNDIDASSALLVLGAAVLVEIALLESGQYLMKKGRANAIDAVNIYNCNYKQTFGYPNDSTISSHNSNKNVK